MASNLSINNPDAEHRGIKPSVRINENLLNNAFLIGGYSSKRETVNTALQEFIQRRKSEE